jgi:hypothetical protein
MRSHIVLEHKARARMINWGPVEHKDINVFVGPEVVTSFVYVYIRHFSVFRSQGNGGVCHVYIWNWTRRIE